MKFPTIPTSAFDLEVQILVENASFEKKALSDVLKALNPDRKQYKEAMKKLEQEQTKAWAMLRDEIDVHLEAINSASALPYKQETIEKLNRAVQQQRVRAAEQKPAQPAKPGRLAR